jgi:hypothetical protein
MRKGFDSRAQGISDKQDTIQSLRQLGELMKNCVGCHASYRIADAQFLIVMDGKPTDAPAEN